jgi:hypothetical protein
MRMGGVSAPIANYSLKNYERCPYHGIPLRTSPRKVRK